jgi:hypothetical protein
MPEVRREENPRGANRIQLKLSSHRRNSRRRRAAEVWVPANHQGAELMDEPTIRQFLAEANAHIADTETRIARQGEIIAEHFAVAAAPIRRKDSWLF